MFKGIIIDATSIHSLELSGFTNIEVEENSEELTEGSAEDFCEWYIDKENELENFSKDYACGQDDGQFFIFSDIETVQNKLKELFPKLPLIEIDPDHYPFDYDYRRDK